jgi:uncharacterized membrane protein
MGVLKNEGSIDDAGKAVWPWLPSVTAFQALVVSRFRGFFRQTGVGGWPARYIGCIEAPPQWAANRVFSKDFFVTILMLGLVLFLGVHSLSIVSPDGRDRLAKRLGELGFKGAYSLVSLVGFVLIIWGYGLSREAPVMLYAMPAGFRHLAALLMLPVFVLLFAAYLPGRIQRAAKHPMLLAVKLWALAHLLAQSVTGGSLADVLLFGGFLAWAVLDRISIKRRTAAGGLRAVPALPAGRANDFIALGGGIVVYLIFVMGLHTAWIGVRPFG